MFDKYKIKKILASPLTITEYLKLSNKIQNNEEVILHLIECDPKGINNIPPDMAIKLLTEKPELAKYLNTNNINDYFSHINLDFVELSSEIVKALNAENAQKYYKHDPVRFMLSYNPEYFEQLYRIIPQIDDNTLIHYFLLVNKERLETLIKNSSLNSKKLIKNAVSQASIDEQIELCHKSDVFESYVTETVLEKINYEKLTDNYVDLDKESIDMFVEKYPHLMRLFDHRVIVKYYKKHLKESNLYDVLFNLTYYRSFEFDLYTSLDFEDKLKSCKANSEFLFWACDGQNNSSEFTLIKNYLLKQIANPELSRAFKKLTEEPYKGQIPFIYYNQRYQGLKILLCDKIVQNNNPELIAKYFENFDRDIFITLLENAYGPHVREIMESRPMLDCHHLNAFDIFDQKIVDNLGMSFVDYFTSYDFNIFSVFIHKLVNDDNTLKSFKGYYELVKNNTDSFDVTLFNRIIDSFIYNHKLLEQVDFNNLSENVKENILLMLNDNYKITIYIDSLEKLENYKSIRKDLLKREYSKKTGLPVQDKKDIIFRLLTGRDIADENAMIEEMNFKNVMEVFNIDNIIKDDSLIQKIGLNKDEVALILLLHEIDHISEPEVLDKLMDHLMNESKLNPTMFKDLFNKIKNYYIKIFKEDLTDLDSLETKNAAGIPITYVDDNKEFNFLCSIIGVGLNSRTVPEPDWSENLLYRWLNQEDGYGEISMFLESSETTSMMHNFNRSREFPVFIFDSDVPILAMGGSDISTSLKSRARVHGFRFIGYNGMRFEDMDALKQHAEESNKEFPNKFSSEIAVIRRKHDLETGTHERVMPRGLVCYQKPTEQELQLAKIFNDYYKKHNLGEFRIVVINSYRHASYMAEEEKTQRMTSEEQWYQESMDIINEGERSR